MIRRLVLAAISVLALQGAAAASEAPRVAVTIKPVHALATALMDGTGKAPELVYAGAASPHVAALKPSQVAMVLDADVLFMIGDGYERLMQRAVNQRVAAKGKTVVLAEAQGVKTMPYRQGANFEAHVHAGEGETAGQGADDHDHETGVDPHVWLDPENARAIARVMATELAADDPDHAALYAKNLASVEAGLDALSNELGTILAPAKGKPFIVFHDAYHYLENRYGLTAAGTIVLNPESTPGAERLKQVRDRIVALNAQCVFAEPQFEVGYVRTVIEGTPAKPGKLDPLGAAIAPGPDAYREMMLDLAHAMADCLAGK
jgi:zinc transport system substrate-binding protein